MKTLLRSLLLTAFVASATFAAAPASAESTLDIITKRGTIIVGISLSTPPFGLTNGQMEPDGYDVAIARLIARDLGVKLQIQDIVAAARVPSITSGKVDIVISSFSITVERAKVVAFTNPIYVDQQVLVSGKDKGMTTIADMKGKRIGVTRSSTNDLVTTKLAPEGTIIQRFDDDAGTSQALVAGQVDAIVTAAGLARAVSAKMPTLGLDIRFVVAQAPMSIGLHRGDEDLLHWLNTDMFLAWTNKEIQPLQEKWFGAANASLPTF